MGERVYDLIIIGGGIGGSTLAKTMADGGADVLLIERESAFRDRVRGEWLASWGVAEAKRLNIYDVIMTAGGHQLRYLRSNGDDPRNLEETTSCRQPSLSFYHPMMQEALLDAASTAGAVVWRDATASMECRNGKNTVIAYRAGKEARLQARLIVAADGRNSMARKRANFKTDRDPEKLSVAGLLLDDMTAPDDSVHTWLDSWSDADFGLFALLFPQGGGRVRVYMTYMTASSYRLSGPAAISQFIQLFSKVGFPAEYFDAARISGPLASYSGADAWVVHPYQNGVALIGDAAAASDPTHGQGLSLTLRDVRVLSELLLSHDHWDEAGHAYAAEHDRYYGVSHTYASWMKELIFSVGDEAGERREKVRRLWSEDSTRDPDIVMSGPDQTLDEEARRRCYGME